MLSFLAGYRRRRGWAAWHGAALQRFDFDGDFPTLDQLMGERPPRQAQSAEDVSNNLMTWMTVLEAKGED